MGWSAAQEDCLADACCVALALVSFVSPAIRRCHAPVDVTSGVNVAGFSE